MEIDKSTDSTVARDEPEGAASAPTTDEGTDPNDPQVPPPPVVGSRGIELPFRIPPLLLWLVGATVSLVALAGILAISVSARTWGTERWDWDQYVLRPGSATSATDAISVDGQELFPPEGDIAFTTVAIVRDPTVWQIYRAPSTAGHILVDPELIDGTRTREETRQVTRFQMVRSQDDASVVALRYLGFDPQPVDRGAVVVQLVPGQVAETVLALGDTIVGVNGQPVARVEDVVAELTGTRPGDEATFEVQRLGETTETEMVTVALGQRPPPAEGEPELTPEQLEAGFLGISMENDPSLIMPFEIDVNVGQVRGPSAGLAFSLAIVEVLTPGSLTGGLKVATTGTIDINGSVGQVGGVTQKTLAAESEGVQLFLVPPEELEEALASADKMEVRAVTTFDEAIDVLVEFGGNGREVQGSLGGDA